MPGSERADLVVVGKRGTGSLKEFVVGSTVDRLLGRSRKPLLVVKRGNEGPYRQVLVPVDFTDYSEAALVTAASLAQDDAAIHVFHARSSSGEFELQMADVPGPVIREYREMKQGEARARIHELITKVGVEARRVFACVAQGDARRLILDHEKLLQADLIVAGKQGRSAMADFLLGSVASRLLADSNCDVLIIPRTSTESHDHQRTGPGFVTQSRHRDGRIEHPTAFERENRLNLQAWLESSPSVAFGLMRTTQQPRRAVRGR